MSKAERILAESNKREIVGAIDNLAASAMTALLAAVPAPAVDRIIYIVEKQRSDAKDLVREELRRIAEVIKSREAMHDEIADAYARLQAGLAAEKPARCEPLSAEAEAALNPGVRRLVKLLRIEGFDTCDSGDGKTRKHACDAPGAYVHVRVHPDMLASEARRLLALMRKADVAIADSTTAAVRETNDASAACITATYDPVDGEAFITLEGVDDEMMFGREGGDAREDVIPVTVDDVPALALAPGSEL